MRSETRSRSDATRGRFTQSDLHPPKVVKKLHRAQKIRTNRSFMRQFVLTVRCCRGRQTRCGSCDKPLPTNSVTQPLFRKSWRKRTFLTLASHPNRCRILVCASCINRAGHAPTPAAHTESPAERRLSAGRPGLPFKGLKNDVDKSLARPRRPSSQLCKANQTATRRRYCASVPSQKYRRATHGCLNPI